MNSTEPVLLIFAKKPIPGQVKTRFLPDTSPENAAAIAHEMIRMTINTAVTGWPGPIQLMAGPDSCHPFFESISQKHNIALTDQCSGSLGTKMETAICQTLDSAPAAILGCDIPSVSKSMLQYAYHRMQAGNNVMGPSADGGFYFIGLHQCFPGMFDAIPWGTDQVLELVLRRLRGGQIMIDVMLSCLQDIDTWSDFLWAAQFESSFQEFLCKINS